MAIANPGGGLELAKDYWVSFPEGYRAHQIRLEGGDCSTRLVLLSLGLSVGGADWTLAGLWLAVVASGLYHGLNPGMGWPLAVSAGLLERTPRAMLVALGYLAAGHLLAMLAVTLPFALLAALLAWQQLIQIGASLLVLGFGLYLLIQRRHPRALARIPPTQLALWSFAIAMAHGAGLMLVPVYLGLLQRGQHVGTSRRRRDHQCQSRHGHVGIDRPHPGDGHRRRGSRLAGLSVSRTQIRVAELVQPRCALVDEPRARRCSVARFEHGRYGLTDDGATRIWGHADGPGASRVGGRASS